jgi:hypothetical protein
MTLNLLNPAQPKTYRGDEMNLLSGRQATKLLKISPNTFAQAVEDRVLRSSIPPDVIGGRPAYGFDEKYILQIKKLLPKVKKGGRGYKVFTEELKKRIAKINKDKFGE